MKPRPVDECLAASSLIIAKTRSKQAELQFSVDTCLTRIEVSADAIAASQALLAKLNGESFTSDGADADTLLERANIGGAAMTRAPTRSTHRPAA
jgi:hypothetical protein